jgi:hypothetical protein
LAGQIQIGLGRRALLLDESVQQDHVAAFQDEQHACKPIGKPCSHFPDIAVDVVATGIPSGQPN